jgi:hypothetical protein
MDIIALQIAETTHLGPEQVVVTARCIARIALGMTVSDLSRTTALRVTMIERYPGVYIDVLEPPHAAQIALHGEHADMIEPGANLVLCDSEDTEPSIHKS